MAAAIQSWEPKRSVTAIETSCVPRTAWAIEALRLRAIVDARERLPIDVLGCRLKRNPLHLALRPHGDGDLFSLSAP